ncbi:MAG TPA: zinc dependent phospholipase C family protein [Puia sp.]|nr:zinc dependent phospholipase C family protein [Puia sp.]
MQPFFFKNLSPLLKESIQPDIRRNAERAEAPKHFIDLEMYGDSSEWKMPLDWDDAVRTYSKDTLIKYGYIPYEVIMEKNDLTNAMRGRNADSILFYAGDLCHYVSDANVPLHTTMNYDGQLSKQNGIHALWETQIPQIELNQYILYARHEAAYLNNPEETIWNGIRTAHHLLKNIFALETETSKMFSDSTKFHTLSKNGKLFKNYTNEFAKAYGKKLGRSINDQLIRSVNMVSDFWFTCWVDAGKPDLSNLLPTSFTKEDKIELTSQNEAYRHNKLIEKNVLISRKNDTAGP